jgi:hypothetical protein
MQLPTNALVLRMVHTLAELHFPVANLSWQRAIVASLWVCIVLYFSDHSLTQGFFYIYRCLKRFYALIRGKFRG